MKHNIGWNSWFPTLLDKQTQANNEEQYVQYRFFDYIGGWPVSTDFYDIVFFFLRFVASRNLKATQTSEEASSDVFPFLNDWIDWSKLR